LGPGDLKIEEEKKHMKSSMKPLTGFVKKCCLVASNARYPRPGALLDLTSTGVINYNAPVIDQFTFLEMLEDQGFRYSHKKGSCWFRGITVLPNYRVE